MSLAHEQRLVELETQTTLLERLQLLTNFNSNLINVSGVSGSGKTWIAHHYLEAWAANKNQALLMCHPNQADDQQRRNILQQLMPQAVINQHDSLVDSFNQLVGENEKCDIVIVIDDADKLSQEFVAQLWELVLSAHQNAQWVINVLLFSQLNSLDAFLRKISHGQEEKPVEIEIEPLTPAEAVVFVDSLVVRYLKDYDRKEKVKNEVKKTEKYPGKLMALGEEKVTSKRIVIKRVVSTPLGKVALVLLPLSLLAGGYFWFFADQSIDTTAYTISKLALPPRDKLQKVAATEAVLLAESEPAEILSTVAPSNEQAPVTTDIAEQTTLVATDPVSPDGGVDKRQATVVAANDKEATAKPNVSKPHLSTAQEVVKIPPKAAASTIAEKTPAANQRPQVNKKDKSAIKQPQTKAEQEETTAPVSKAANKIKPIEKNKQAANIWHIATKNGAKYKAAEEALKVSSGELKKLSKRRYTLQLAALTSETEIASFLNEHELEGQVRIYSTQKKGKLWYIVTYKDFATIEQARKSITSLSKSAQKLGPWAKSIAQVHKEISNTP